MPFLLRPSKRLDFVSWDSYGGHGDTHFPTLSTKNCQPSGPESSTGFEIQDDTWLAFLTLSEFLDADSQMFTNFEQGVGLEKFTDQWLKSCNIVTGKQKSIMVKYLENRCFRNQ